MSAISVEVPEDLAERLNKLVAHSGNSQAFYVREALAEYIQDLEDYYLADKRASDLREGRSHTQTLDEVERELGLVD